MAEDRSASQTTAAPAASAAQQARFVARPAPRPAIRPNRPGEITPLARHGLKGHRA